jgi:hypothetical protein
MADSSLEKFSDDDSETIRAAFRGREGNLRCPRCQGPLVDEVYGGGGTVSPVHEIRCKPCELYVLAALGR